MWTGSRGAGNRLRRIAPITLASLLGATGCFFSSGINQEPQATVQVVSQGPYYRGSMVTASAAKSSDPDGDEVRVSWSARLCNAAHTDCDRAFLQSPPRGRDEPFVIDAIPAYREGGGITEALVVVAEVIDDQDARRWDQVFIDVLNRHPTLLLQPQGFLAPSGSGYPIGTTVRVVAGGSDPDGDALTYDWRYIPASGSVPQDVHWAAVDAITYELAADVTGPWRVEVTATDPQGASITEEVQIIFQEDAPPCIGTTDPPAAPSRYIVEREAQPRRFAVVDVRDDLDVHPLPAAGDDTPLGSPTFRWLVATPDTGGALVEVPGSEAAYLLDASPHAPGDVLTLRVEIDDRVGRTLPCSDEQDTCSLGGNDCMQRVTWNMEVR